MDVHTRQCPELKLFINNLEKVLTIEKSAANLEFPSTACEKLNAAGTHEKLLRYNDTARARCPSTTFEHQV